MLPDAAYQADIKTIYALIALQLLGYVGVIIFWVIRSRTKVTEQLSAASIEERAAEHDAARERERAALEEKKRTNDLMFATLELVRDAQRNNREERSRHDKFQEEYQALANVRTDQLDKVSAQMKDIRETEEVQRELATRTESMLKEHVKESESAIKTVQEIPTTLQRIEQSVGQLDEQLKNMPQTIQAEINPVKETVDEIKKQLQELVNEVRRIPDAMAPVPAKVVIAATLVDVPAEPLPNPPPLVFDPGKTQPIPDAPKEELPQ